MGQHVLSPATLEKRQLRLLPVAVFTLTCLALLPWFLPGEVDFDDMQQAVAGLRCVQPRLSGFNSFESCASGAELIPRTQCGECPKDQRRDQLVKVQIRLEQLLARESTSNLLHAAAIGRLILGFDRASEIERAITNLQEALAVEQATARRVVLLSDLAASYLLLAEVLQDPLAVAIALEKSLEALQYDPGNKAASFNAELASSLLGAQDQAEPKSGDFWLSDLRRRFSLETLQAPTDCATVASFRSSFDEWAAGPNPESLAAIIQERSCPALVGDRFFDELLDQATSDTTLTARSWQIYREAEAALYRFEVQGAEASLGALEVLRPDLPIRLAAKRLRAIIYYQRKDYDGAWRLLQRLAGEATSASFFWLSGEARYLMALIAQIRGEFGEAFRQVGYASEVAEKTRSKTLEAAVANLQLELVESVGREDEAWRSVTEALRSTGQNRQPTFRLMTVRSAANLARDRGLLRVARLFCDRGVDLSRSLPPELQVSSLRIRGELLAEIGQLEMSRSDWHRARHILEENSSIDPEIAKTIETDLLLLEGRVAADLDRRRVALEAVKARYQEFHYDYKILVAEHALARLQRQQGDTDAATITLEEALDELTEHVKGAGKWITASALVHAVRSLTEELVDLKLEDGDPEDLRQALARILGLRSGAVERTRIDELPTGHQRLTSFVLPTKVVLLLEHEGRLTLAQSPVNRRRLVELQQRLLLLLRTNADEVRIWRIAEELSDLLLAPVAGHLSFENTLTVIVDDFLAGLPIHILPVGSSGELLIDRIAIRYSHDYQFRVVGPPPETMVAVGISNAPAGRLDLAAAVSEAQEVAALYPGSNLVLEDEARVDGLLERIAYAESFHFSGHFILNTRSPLDSYLWLGGEVESSRLTLEKFLVTAGPQTQLLYLSACDTGSGLPPSAQGLASLSQAFTSSGVEQTILALWPLEDRVGKKVAVAFHRNLRAGRPAAEALRVAQLAQRSKHPAVWAPLVVVQ